MPDPTSTALQVVGVKLIPCRARHVTRLSRTPSQAYPSLRLITFLLYLDIGPLSSPVFLD
jgi:hypothetical protein